MLLANLSVDFSWELRADGNALCLLEQPFLEQVLYLQIMLHFDQLEDSELAILVSDLEEDGVFFYFNLEYLRVGGVEQRELVVKVVDLYFVHGLLGLDFDDIIAKELQHFLLSFERVIVLFLWLGLEEAFEAVLLFF